MPRMAAEEPVKCATTAAVMPVPRSSPKASLRAFAPPKEAMVVERARQSSGMVRAKGITIRRHQQRKTASDSAAVAWLWMAAIHQRLRKGSVALLMTLQAMGCYCCSLAGVVAVVAPVEGADRCLWAERKTTRRQQRRPKQQA
jgi:hypothetical protein